MREIITLQFGNYANHVGSHFWNSQDEMLGPGFLAGSNAEMDPSILFMSTAHEVLTPRALVFDFKDNPGMLHAQRNSQQGAHGRILDTPSTQSIVQGATDHLQNYLDATGPSDTDLPADWRRTVTHWGHFLKAQFSSKSLIPLGSRSSTAVQLGSGKCSSLSMASSFDAFSDGFGVLNEEIEDAFRALLEDCDGLQGLQILSDVDSGFGGLAVEMMQAIREELPRTAVASFVCGETASTPGTTSLAGSTDYAVRDRSSMSAMNWATGLHMWARDASDVGALCIPFSFKGASRSQLNAMTGGTLSLDNLYETSALLACSLDMFTSPSRRHAEYRGGLLQLSECHYPDSWKSVASEESAWRASPESVAVDPLISFAGIIEGIMPTLEHRLADIALWLPAPILDASASAYANALMDFGCAPPGSSWQSVSRFCGLPTDSPMERHLPVYIPLAHMTVARGAGTKLADTANYNYSLSQYGSATEYYLQSVPCPQAMQCMLRSPLPVPISFPNTVTPTDQGQLPLFIPALSQLSIGSRSILPLECLIRKFETRDKSTMYRFGESAHMPSDAEIEDSLHTLLELHASHST